MVLRCTTRLLKQLGLRAATLRDVPASDDDFYANLVWIDRRKCLLLMHAGTLFPVFASDVRQRDLQRLGPFVVERVEGALRDEHLPGDALGALDPSALTVATTASRSVLGFMNDATVMCRYDVDLAGGLADIDVAALDHRLRRTLHNRDGYHDALTLLRERRQGGGEPTSTD